MFIYQDIVDNVMTGDLKSDTRGGVRTVSKFGVVYALPMTNGFPLLTTKQVEWKNIILENLWFLSGSNKLDFLHKHNIHFWDPWMEPDGTVPSAYGFFWRQFPGVEYRPGYAWGLSWEEGGYSPTPTDQIEWVVNKLKNNPRTRQACVSAWNPQNIVKSSLPPCHSFFVLNVSGTETDSPQLNLALTQRSCDVALGLPYNIAGYAFLTHLFSKFLGFMPGEFLHTLVDAHIYIGKEDGDEWDHRPGLEEQLSRTPYELPTLKIDDRVKDLKDIKEIIAYSSTKEILDIFKMENYKHHPKIKFNPAV